MFESVIGPQVRIADESVFVWMEAGAPARVFYNRARWRVQAARLVADAASAEVWRCVLVGDGATSPTAVRLSREAGAWRADPEWA